MLLVAMSQNVSVQSILQVYKVYKYIVYKLKNIKYLHETYIAFKEL